jgi:hypothetical protein
MDESGQDASAAFFVVVAVVSDQEQERVRQELSQIERLAGTGRRKWHKSRPERRRRSLELVIEREIGKGEVFFGSYPKPLPYFFPMLDVLEWAIKQKVVPPYTARVYVDGIDRRKAAELTNALRVRGITLDQVKGRRDESEPGIRLADMWAGCVRAALHGSATEQTLLDRARRARYLAEIPKHKIP